MAPATRLSLGLAAFAASILLVADVVGLIPDAVGERMQARKSFAESLAIQISVSASRSDFSAVKTTIQEVVSRKEELLSAGLRRTGGNLVTSVGPHSAYWETSDDEKSTATQITVPILQRGQPWGGLELRYTSIAGNTWIERIIGSGLGLIPFFVVSAFFGFRYVHNRALAVLDPKSVVPDRVKVAFDTLTEGVLILDAKERVILANAPLADKLDVELRELIGKPASSFPWIKGENHPLLPWQITLKDGLQQVSTPLKYQPPGRDVINFSLNCGIINDDKGRSRGVLVTFDDISNLEEKNRTLEETITQLEVSEEQVREKNKELERLATRDPLTGSFNRRTFFERFEALFSHAVHNDEPLCAIMTDIDHFKSVNDRYGHAVGDKVIKIVAEILEITTRGEDIVGRYGGEEFCVVLPGLGKDEAIAVAERLRTEIYESSAAKFTSGLRFTASLGVAQLNDSTPDPAELVNQADQALYKAKQTGRNKVVFLDRTPMADADDNSGSPAEDTPQPDSTTETSSSSTEEARALRARVHELEIRLEERERELRKRYGRDELTGLPNRLLFHDRIEQAIARSKRSKKLVAILSLDIDQFNRINEAVGVSGGNEVLRLLATRLSDVLRDDDTVAVVAESSSSTITVSRIANDEFGISLADILDRDSIPGIIRRIIRALTAPVTIEGVELFPTVSVGASVFPMDSESAETLFKNAGAARREVKRTNAPNHWLFYDDNLNKHALSRLKKEGQLRQALENHQFELFYQPRITLQSGKVSSAEALIRLHQGDNLLFPGDFIPLAEEAGLINGIGEWVVSAACQQLAAWDRLGIDTGIAVNVSTIELQQGDLLVERILRHLGTAGIDPTKLELEITESVLMDKSSSAISALNRLRGLGLTVAIDDFGTGYSSLSQLRDLPVNAMKIDRSFVDNLNTDVDSRGLIDGMIKMAHSLGLKVVAEGVENDSQLQSLRDLECDEVQGYLFAKPLPIEQFTRKLAKDGTWSDREISNVVTWPRRLTGRLR